eukprot:TRINITY_DN7048_c0_g1_i1.p1 TRINITY_DN7048_c0_g1~~TRINITY_DN7048_c0_g1_i1.p1  ORF type:complete len:816 (+),score=150.06 TRINITY_DN7048_c0_g1_i1:63-2450(+)
MLGQALLLSATSLTLSSVPVETDCGLLKMAFDKSTQLLGGTPNRDVYDALQLHNCNVPPPTTAAKEAVCQHRDLSMFDKVIYATPDKGSLSKAIDEARQLRTKPNNELIKIAIVLKEGIYFESLDLDSRDSNTHIVSDCGSESTIMSGGYDLGKVTFTKNKDTVPKWVATVPRGLEPDQLFVVSDSDKVGTRMVLARQPNGNAETDLQPQGYALAAGNPFGKQPLPSKAGPVEGLSIQTPTRNNSFYPDFGTDNDPRGKAVWRSSGGNAYHYEDNIEWWNQSLPAGLKWNTTGGGKYHQPGFNADGWPANPSPEPILHAMHIAEWGNHIFSVDGVDHEKGGFSFSKGGFQEGRMAVIQRQPFYVENIINALDHPGEWFYDPSSGALSIIPNITGVVPTQVSLQLVFSNKTTIVQSSGVSNANIEDVTFAHTRRTLLSQYSVPSPGDWSVHQGGAVVVQNSNSVAITGCQFNRLGGNAIALLGENMDAEISKNEFNLIGDSAIIVIGRLNAPGNDGNSGSFPKNTKILSNHIHAIGIWGKQVSALFQAVACNTTFSGNVAYNGPRAGINVNDGFCGNLVIENNVLFNWVRETQDHGPINTWDRACYHQPGGGIYPRWNRVVRNLILNGPSGNRDMGNLFPAVDNDDGSAYYWIADNVCAYGGFKNFLGNDKVWINNMLLYPEGRQDGAGDGQCLMAWGGENEVYQNNTCVTRDGSPIGVDTYPWKYSCSLSQPARPLLPALKGNTYYTTSGSYSLSCGKSYTLKELFLFDLEVGSTVSKIPPSDQLISEARARLGL